VNDDAGVPPPRLYQGDRAWYSAQALGVTWTPSIHCRAFRPSSTRSRLLTIPSKSVPSTPSGLPFANAFLVCVSHRAPEISLGVALFPSSGSGEYPSRAASLRFVAPAPEQKRWCFSKARLCLYPKVSLSALVWGRLISNMGTNRKERPQSTPWLLSTERRCKFLLAFLYMSPFLRNGCWP
jgi:hypothetical protein